MIRMIRTVFRNDDDLVMAFDEKNRMIGKYSGLFEEVRESIVKDASANTEFYGKIDVSPMTKEKWLKEE